MGRVKISMAFKKYQGNEFLMRDLGGYSIAPRLRAEVDQQDDIVTFSRLKWKKSRQFTRPGDNTRKLEEQLHRSPHCSLQLLVPYCSEYPHVVKNLRSIRELAADDEPAKRDSGCTTDITFFSPHRAL